MARSLHWPGQTEPLVGQGRTAIRWWEKIKSWEGDSFTRKTSMIGYIFVTDQMIAGVSGAQHRGHERARYCCWCCRWCPEQVNNNVLTPKHTPSNNSSEWLLLTMNTMIRGLWSRVASNGQCLFSQSQKSTPQQPTVRVSFDIYL